MIKGKNNSQKATALSLDISVVVNNGEGIKDVFAIVSKGEQYINSKKHASNVLVMDLLKFNSFPVNVFNYSLQTVTVDQDSLNTGFHSMAYEVSSLRQINLNERRPDWDINADDALKYYDKGDNYEWDAMRASVGHLKLPNNIFLVNKIISCYRVIVTKTTRLSGGKTEIHFSAPFKAFSAKSTGYSFVLGTTYTGPNHELGSGDKLYKIEPDTTIRGGFQVIIPTNISLPYRTRMLLIDKFAGGKSTSQGIVVKIDRRLKQIIDRIVMHELGHYIAGLSDTKSVHINESDATVMNYSEKIESYEFIRRDVEEVVTGSGMSYSPKRYVNQWIEAKR